MSNQKDFNSIENDVLSINVTPQAFDTAVLAHYLTYRVYDYLHDEEPREDKFCEAIPKDVLHDLLKSLQSVNKIYEAKNPPKEG